MVINQEAIFFCPMQTSDFRFLSSPQYERISNSEECRRILEAYNPIDSKWSSESLWGLPMRGQKGAFDIRESARHSAQCCLKLAWCSQLGHVFTLLDIISQNKAILRPRQNDTKQVHCISLSKHRQKARSLWHHKTPNILLSWLMSDCYFFTTFSFSLTLVYPPLDKSFWEIQT